MNNTMDEKEVSKTKKKILWISDGPDINSGYGNQTKGITQGLKEVYDIFCMSFQRHGQPIVLDGVTLLPNGYNMWGDDIIEYHLKNIKPDYVVILMDMFRPARLLKDMKGLREKYGGKWIAYFPLDAAPLPWGSEEVFKSFDHRVAMSDHGKTLMAKLLPEAPVDCRIWHGTDTETYKPMLKDYKIGTPMAGEFVFGSVFRNCARKNPSALLFAFYKLNKQFPKTKLYLHTDPNDPSGMNLGGMINRLGLQKQVIFTQMHSVFCSLPAEKLNEIYNLMDVHILSTTGEGFGIPIIEAMSAGKPNIMTDYTTADELIGDNERGIKVPYIKGITTQCAFLTERAYIDTYKLYEAMQKMVVLGSDRVKEKYQAKCRWQAQDKFDWKVIQHEWREYFEGLEAKYGSKPNDK